MSIYSIMAFNAAADKVKQNVKDSADIDQKRVQTQQAQEELELNKKLYQAKVKQARNEGMMSDYVGQQLEKKLNEAHKAKADQLDAISGLQDISQHKVQAEAAQAGQIATQLHAQDPDVQAHVQTLTGIMGAQGQQVQPPMSMPDGSVSGNQGIGMPSIPGIAPTQSPQGQVKPAAPTQDLSTQLTGQQEPAPEQATDETAGTPEATNTSKQGIDLSPVEEAFGMPSGSMWLNPATMKPEINPIWKTKAEAKERATENYNINQPFRDAQREDRNIKTAETYLVNALKQRGGAIGLQNAKVDAAIHARALISQSYDPATGNYNVSQVPYGELSESMGALLSGQSGTSEGRIAALKQRTAKGDLNGAITYLTGKPSNATSQEALKQLVDIIDRQGEVSEELRDNAFNKLKGLSTFKRLNEEDFASLKDTHLGNSFKEVLAKSPDKNVPTFKSIAEAEAANVPSGTIVIINGKRARSN